LDEYILFSKNGEGSFEVKIPFSSDALTQVSDMLTREGFLVDKEKMEELKAELAELKSMIAEVRKENEDLGRLMQDIVRGFRSPEVKPPQTAPSPPKGKPDVEEFRIPDGKIAMLPSSKTKAFELISRLAKEHMDREFTTSGLTLYEKRVFSLLVKRYEFVKSVRKEGRNIVYVFHKPALESICNELAGSASLSVRSRIRIKSMDDFLEKMKGRYPHFSYHPVSGRSPNREYKLLFSDKSVKKSILGNLTRTFGPGIAKIA